MMLKTVYPKWGIEEKSSGPFNPNDERYTVAYIERESWLIIRHMCGKKRNWVMSPNRIPVDERIVKRWGLR
jgi:hypothetical protein